MDTTTRNSVLIGVVGAGVSAAMAYAGEPQWAIAVGLGAAVTALVNYALENKEEITEAIEEAVEEHLGIDVELDSIVDDVLEEAKDVAEDLADDGKLNNSTGEVNVPLTVEEAKDAFEEIAEQTKESLSKLTVKELKEMLKTHGKPISGNKADLIERLLE